MSNDAFADDACLGPVYTLIVKAESDRESTALRMWAVPRRHVSHTRAVKAEVVGTYRVYCGQGWEHTFDIDEEFAFDIEHPPDELSRRLAEVWNSGDPDVATDAAHLLVERVLQDWSDPCDVTGDEL